MPKKKTTQKKKKEKQVSIQKQIRAGQVRDLFSAPANAEMVCAECKHRQKNRAFCYFCQAVSRLPQCAECGRTKCLSQTSDCLVKHKGASAVGMQFVGCICDFCEAFVCHSRKCIANHTCPSCSLEGAACLECSRDVANHGGRFFKCATCEGWLCEDDQFEHQASCTYIESENYQCISCSRFGIWSCLKCKICFCDVHVKGTFKVEKGTDPLCKKCRGVLKVTKDFSVSSFGFDLCVLFHSFVPARAHEFGRQGYDDDDDGGGDGGNFGFYGYGGSYAPANDDDDDYDNYNNEEEEEEEEAVQLSLDDE